MKRLAILGASGHGKVVADCAEYAGWDEVVFFDDAWPKMEKNSHWLIVGDTKTLINTLTQYDGVIVAIGNNSIRLKKQRKLAIECAPLVNIIHPKAQISQYVKMGIGCAVMPGAIINIDTKIGDSCIVNTGATVDHDCVLGDAVHICPGSNLAGEINIGDLSWIGIGSTIIQQINIGQNTFIGAGSVVTNDIDGNSTMVGNPARLLKSKK